MKNCVCTGRVTKDAEIVIRKIGENEVPVTNFNVAVNTRTQKKGADGKNIVLTDYFRVTLWREQAKAMVPYLTKGREISVMGDFTLETWMDQSNQVHPILHFTSPQIELLGANRKTEVPVEPEVVETEDPDELPFD